MAVPSTAYKGRVTINKAANTPVVHLAGVLHTNNATHKALFYLDDLIAINVGASNTAWIGITFPGSANHEMHAANRRGSGRKGSGVWLNDQFLTKGIVLNFLNMLKHANYATFSAIFKSAYYLNTTQYGIRHRKLGASTWNTDIHGTSIVQAGQTNVPRYLIRWGYAKNDTVQFEAYVTNQEGPFYTVTQSAVMLSPIEEYIVQLRTVACTSTTNTLKIWLTTDDNDALDQIGQDVPIGGQPIINFYTDPERTIKATSGFYAYLRANKSFYVDNNGRVSYWVNCPVQPVFIYVNLRAFVNFENGDISQLEISTAETHSFAITVTGRVQNSTNHGKEFSLTIPIGQKSASDPSFNLQRNPAGSTYHFEAVGATPTGQSIQVVYNSSI